MDRKPGKQGGLYKTGLKKLRCILTKKNCCFSCLLSGPNEKLTKRIVSKSGLRRWVCVNRMPALYACMSRGWGYLSMLWSTESESIGEKNGCTSAASGRSAQWGVVRGFGARQLVVRGSELPQFRHDLRILYIKNYSNLRASK